MNSPASSILKIISKHKLAVILLVGTVARLILMPISAHPFDIYAWYGHSMSILDNGPFFLQGFPPLWYHYMMVPIAYAYDWLANVFQIAPISMDSIPAALNFYPSYNIQVVPGLLFNFVVKLPFLISDVLVTLLLYKIVKELTNNNKLAETAALFWFLNPYLIWISAGWGMWDTLPALFSLAAFYLLLRKQYALSAVFLSLGVACKLYPALFLVPIAIYLVKTSAANERWKSFGKFYSVFAVSSVLLFLPYLGMIASFFTGMFLPSTGNGAAIVVDPVVEPVGFGLTYWSLYLLNRLIQLPVTASFVSYASMGSLVLVIVSLVLVYWKVSKLSFRMPAFDLGAAMLFSVVALFLSHRVICEQFFVWALPFLVILCVGGRVKSVLYWGISFVALLYSVLNCPLPFFFLPLAPWAQNSLLDLVYFIWWVEPFRIVSLAVLGSLFSVLLLIIIIKLMRWHDVK